jgi:hypothetical protein
MVSILSSSVVGPRTAPSCSTTPSSPELVALDLEVVDRQIGRAADCGARVAACRLVPLEIADAIDETSTTPSRRVTFQRVASVVTSPARFWASQLLMVLGMARWQWEGRGWSHFAGR